MGIVGCFNVGGDFVLVDVVVMFVGLCCVVFLLKFNVLVVVVVENGIYNYVFFQCICIGGRVRVGVLIEFFVIGYEDYLDSFFVFVLV